MAESRGSQEPGSFNARPEVHVPADDVERTGLNTTNHRSRRSGGFLLDNAFSNPSPVSSRNSNADRNGKRKAQNGQLQVDKRRSTHNRLSAGSSVGNSPLSREVSMDETLERGVTAQSEARTSNIDPAQLVQMALSLSESRRRHTSNSLQIPPATASRRMVSQGSPLYDTVRSKPSQRSRSGRLPSQRREESGASNASASDRASYESALAGSQDDDTVYDFSPATLARAEKARKHFELATEYRRLLEYLPPLKSDATAAGNYTFSSKNSPGSAHPHITRVQSYLDNKHELGRPYNPLQALRDRRTRARERRPLVFTTESFGDVDIVRNFIDNVGNISKQPEYRTGDETVRLPALAGVIEESQPAAPQSRHHRRTDTAGSRITRSENDWSIEPQELLADACWLEQGDNKSLIENWRGNRIFPALGRKSVEKPRQSKEHSRTNTNDIMNDRAHNGTERPNDRGRKRLNLLSVHRIDGGKKRHSRDRSTSTVSSSGSDNPDRRRRMNRALNSDEDNFGPLERHMRHMISKDKKGELSSPELISPDHWDSRHTPFPNLKGEKNGNRNGSAPEDDVPLARRLAHGRRASSADGRLPSGDDRPRSSFDDPDSTEPNSPVNMNFIPPMGMDLSPPHSRRPSPGRRSKRSRLNVFKDRNNTERTDFAFISSKNASREASRELPDDARSSVESSRPSQIKRHRTADSFTSSLHKSETSRSKTGRDGSFKEPSSTVARFFKGGRIGDLVRTNTSRLGDYSWNKDKPGDNSIHEVNSQTSDLSETDDPDTDETGFKRRPGVVSGETSAEASPRASLERTRTKPKYFMSNLPSFKSPSASNGHTPGSAMNDPISRQQAAQREAGHSERFDRLAPPRIDVSPQSSPDAAKLTSSTMDTYDRRKSYGFLAPRDVSPGASNVSLGLPGQMGRRGLQKMPMTGLSGISSAYHRTPSRSPHDGRRHWSISDRAQREQTDKVTSRDIARVRALLLSSGIKAREIQKRADSVRDRPHPNLVEAAKFMGEEVPRVSRREEHVMAARLLSKHLSSSISTNEEAISTFEHKIAMGLFSQLDDLRDKAREKLTRVIENTEADADAFTVKLTTQQTLEVKQVDDAIDIMFRNRRRRFRLVRRAGFKLLEWTVMGVMWWVWFVVVLINFAKALVLGTGRAVRWLLWL